MAACLPCLQSELTLIKPAMLVLPGSTAAQTLIGRHFRITREHSGDRKHMVAVDHRDVSPVGAAADSG